MMHCSGPITSVGDERAIFSAFACGLCNEGFPLPLDAWDGLFLAHRSRRLIGELIGY